MTGSALYRIYVVMETQIPRQSVELYFGNITEAVKKLAREIKYRDPGRSLSNELRPALRELMRKYGIDAPSDEEKSPDK